MTRHASQDHEIPMPIANAVLAIRRLGVEWVRRYHRLEITGDVHRPDAPVLFVANHGFGGISDPAAGAHPSALSPDLSSGCR